MSAKVSLNELTRNFQLYVGDYLIGTIESYKGYGDDDDTEPYLVKPYPSDSFEVDVAWHATLKGAARALLICAGYGDVKVDEVIKRQA